MTLQLSVFSVLGSHRQGVTVPPAQGDTHAKHHEQRKERPATDTGASKEISEPTNAPMNEEATRDAGDGEVRLSHFAFKYAHVMQYFFDNEYACYSDMPLQDGMHDYIPDVKKHKSAFVTIMSNMGMNYDYENTSIRVYIIQTFGHKLSDDRDKKEGVLQGIADFMCNVYLNKRKVPKKFWHTAYLKR